MTRPSIFTEIPHLLHSPNAASSKGHWENLGDRVIFGFSYHRKWWCHWIDVVIILGIPSSSDFLKTSPGGPSVAKFLTCDPTFYYMIGPGLGTSSKVGQSDSLPAELETGSRVPARISFSCCSQAGLHWLLSLPHALLPLGLCTRCSLCLEHWSLDLSPHLSSVIPQSLSQGSLRSPPWLGQICPLWAFIMLCTFPS